jgi:hypothetical protein
MALTVALTGDAGAPQAGVTIDGLSTGTACAIVVTVSWDGGATWYPVRGGSVTGILGSTFIRDYFPPLNVTATYQAIITGGTSVTWSTTVLITSPTAWIQDPLAPKSSVALYADMSSGHVLLTLGSLANATWSQLVDTASVMGTDTPAASIGIRQKVSVLPFVLTYDVAAEGGALHNMLMNAGQVVIRGLPAVGLLDPVAYCSLGDATETREAAGTVSEWTLTARQVTPVTMRIVVPWWTFDMVKTLVLAQMGTSVTFDQVKAAQPTGKTFTQWLANPGVL